MTISYNENVLIMPKKEKLHKKIVKCIDFEKCTYTNLQKHLRKNIIPLLEKSLQKRDLTYLRMQLMTLSGENQFYNTDAYYYCMCSQSYSCFYFLSPTKFHIIPESHIMSGERKMSSLKAYKTKNTYDCTEGTIICIPSNSHYYFDTTEGHVLQMCDIIPKESLKDYVQKLKTVEVNKNTLIQHFTQRLGSCYKKQLHFSYHWIHFFQYTSIKNSFQYKLCLTDIPPEKKFDHIISYENRPRIVANKNMKTLPFDHFIIMEETQHCVPDNYYLYKFIRIMVLLTTLSICVVFWKDNEVRTFLGNKYKTKSKSINNVMSDEIIPNLIPLVDTC